MGIRILVLLSILTLCACATQPKIRTAMVDGMPVSTATYSYGPEEAIFEFECDIDDANCKPPKLSTTAVSKAAETPLGNKVSLDDGSTLQAYGRMTGEGMQIRAEFCPANRRCYFISPVQGKTQSVAVIPDILLPFVAPLIWGKETVQAFVEGKYVKDVFEALTLQSNAAKHASQ